MNKYNIFIIFSMVLSVFLVLTGCGKVNDGTAVMMNNEYQSEKSKLSLEVVVELAQKKDSLSWDDFEKYDSIDIGSGLYILRYDIDDDFYLLIGGKSKDENPMYIRLLRANNEEDYIDIRTDDVEKFISK